jgi:hypothetical protein
LESSYRRDNAERHFDRANTTEEDLENFEEFMKFCPELKQAIRGFNGDVDVLEQFVGHVSVFVSSFLYAFVKSLLPAVTGSM